jgi:hypothetical protein
MSWDGNLYLRGNQLSINQILKRNCGGNCSMSRDEERVVRLEESVFQVEVDCGRQPLPPFPAYVHIEVAPSLSGGIQVLL